MEYLVYQDIGPRDAQAMVFLHGYPDDSSLWDDQLKHFGGEYRMITLELPNYGAKIQRRMGYDFPEIVAMIKGTLDSLSPPLKGLPLFVAHDWGAVYAYLYAREHHTALRGLVTLDIGARIKTQPSLFGYLLLPSYQIKLGFWFLAAQIPWLGPLLALIVTKLTLAFIGMCGFIVDPVAYSLPKRRQKLSPFQNYPYYYLWKNMLSGKRQGLSPPESLPQCFMYGTRGMKKLMRFHEPQWSEALAKDPKNRVEAFEQSAHWLMLDEPQHFQTVLREFLTTLDNKTT